MSDSSGSNLGLFTTTPAAYEPLAARMRPRSLADYLGQEHILGEGKPLRVALEQGLPHSMILWGPPGVGKTTLARLIATVCDANFESLSAVLSGVKDIREAVERAKVIRLQSGCRSILFVDEVHRFNKAQQDAFLPHIEDGTVIFIGATTENPSFELNNALLSRARVYVLKALTHDTLRQVLDHALTDSERGLGNRLLTITDDIRDVIVQAADGDARRVLNILEVATDLANDGEVTREILEGVLVDNLRRFDNQGEAWYDQLSAFHKSVRGSDPDAALYWMARMIDGGADPLTIVRRLVAIASEDIGNADPRALDLTLNAWQAFERLGAPEGYLAIAHAVTYCACAAKSNAVYLAMKAAFDDVRNNPSHEVPLHLRNAPTRLMEELGYKQGYRYPHDEEYGYAAGENYFPAALGARKYYTPTDRGLERKISEKLAWLKSLDQSSRS